MGVLTRLADEALIENRKMMMSHWMIVSRSAEISEVGWSSSFAKGGGMVRCERSLAV